MYSYGVAMSFIELVSRNPKLDYILVESTDSTCDYGTCGISMNRLKI